MKYLAMLLLFACVHRVPTIRSDYELKELNGFLISNIYVNPYDLDYENEDAMIKYDIIVKNIRSVERSIDLTSSNYTLKDKDQPMACENYKKEKVFQVKSHETFRIICSAIIKKETVPGDSKIILRIPLEKDTAIFSYLLRAEDFQ